MIYYLLDQAKVDLEAITDYVAERNPVAAVKLLRALERRWEMLGDYPHSGVARPDLREAARQVVVDQYVTLYRVTENGVEVVRVILGRRGIGPDDMSPDDMSPNEDR